MEEERARPQTTEEEEEEEKEEAKEKTIAVMAQMDVDAVAVSTKVVEPDQVGVVWEASTFTLILANFNCKFNLILVIKK